MVGFIERFRIEKVSSKLAYLGRYLFTSKMFKYLEKTELRKGGEL
jgi:UTP-glucose-1-phosphate uridylyltransferase